MAYMQIDGVNVTSIADFASRRGVTPSAVKKWVDVEEVESFRKIGNLNLYVAFELESAYDKHSSVGKAVKAMGYVHPDQFKALQDQHSETSRIHAETAAELEKAWEENDALELANAGLKDVEAQLKIALIELSDEIKVLKGRLEVTIIERDELTNQVGGLLDEVEPISV